MSQSGAEPTRTQSSVPITIVLVGLSLLLMLALIGQLLLVVPAYEKHFEDFRMRLPFATELTIAAARFVFKYWFVLVPCILCAFALAGWVSYVIRHQSGSRLLSALWFLLLIGLPLLANATIWAALWIPFKQLEEGLKK